MAGRPPFDQLDADSEDIEKAIWKDFKNTLPPMTLRMTKTTLLNGNRFY